MHKHSGEQCERAKQLLGNRRDIAVVDGAEQHDTYVYTMAVSTDMAVRLVKRRSMSEVGRRVFTSTMELHEFKTRVAHH